MPLARECHEVLDVSDDHSKLVRLPGVGF